MALIIFEGPDGGGKSTLVNHFSRVTGITRIKTSEGPEKHPGEMDERIERYFKEYDRKANFIYDRHPCISQPIYGMIHGQPSPREDLIDELYRLRPVMIYCRPSGPVTHTAEKEWDTPEFLANIDANYSKLVTAYDQWALEHARLIYRIGDDMTTVTQLIQRLVREKIYA